MRYISWLIGIFFMAITTCHAEGLKVGVINIDLVILKSPLAISYNKALSEKFKPQQKELNAAQERLQNKMDTLNYNSYSLSLDERNQLQASVNSEKQSFEQLNKSLQQDLVVEQQKYTKQLMVKLNQIINKIAQDEKHNIIQTSSNILYLDKSVDITQQVIEQLKPE